MGAPRGKPHADVAAATPRRLGAITVPKLKSNPVADKSTPAAATGTNKPCVPAGAPAAKEKAALAPAGKRPAVAGGKGGKAAGSKATTAAPAVAGRQATARPVTSRTVAVTPRTAHRNPAKAAGAHGVLRDAEQIVGCDGCAFVFFALFPDDFTCVTYTASAA